LNEAVNFESQRSLEILSSVNVHLIQEHRLYKNPVPNNEGEEEKEKVFVIERFAEQLSQLIRENSFSYFQKSQTLDSNFPRRLIAATNILSKEEYEARYKKLIEKQTKLAAYGIFAKTHEILTYSQSDAKALSVYLKDFEQKLGVYDVLLQKIETFVTILNNSRFTFKKVSIDSNNGFSFANDFGKPINLTELSSGEQHEVVLLYDLIFNVKNNTLLLIDEPEISLHVTWQRNFLTDLIKIISPSEAQAIVATHSPSIINENWDLVYSLAQ